VQSVERLGFVPVTAIVVEAWVVCERVLVWFEFHYVLKLIVIKISSRRMKEKADVIGIFHPRESNVDGRECHA